MKTEERSVTGDTAYANHYPVIAPLIMGSGVGDGKTMACVMAQAATIDALRKGKTLDKPTDLMECACPVLRRMAINANDINWWKDDMERTEALRPLIPMLLDSRGSLDLTKRRASRITNAVIHELTPMRLEWIAANTKNAKLAKDCRNGIEAIKGIALVTDEKSALKAKETLDGLKKSAYAYAYEAASAYAAAYAYAYAAAYAYEAAYTQKIRYRTAYLELFEELAAMKETT